VTVILGPHSNLSEVLWIFSRFKNENKHLALEQNPHFYNGLPTSPEAYERDFRMDPIETFQHKKISIFVDNPDNVGWVFLDIAGRRRAFCSVWIPNDVIIFKGPCVLLGFSLSDTLLDVCGRLEGESIVGEAIEGIPNLWYFKEFPLSPSSQPALSPNRNSPSRTMNATQLTSATGILIRDWREPIRRMLQHPVVNIHITDKQPSIFGSSHST
jgi:hypothetical protein